MSIDPTPFWLYDAGHLTCQHYLSIKDEMKSKIDKKKSLESMLVIFKRC